MNGPRKILMATFVIDVFISCGSFTTRGNTRLPYLSYHLPFLQAPAPARFFEV